MIQATQYDVPILLQMAGAKPRGNRHDCPKCGTRRTVTNTADCFFCHHCQWKGNGVTLAKELGVYRRLPGAEYRELSRRRERARIAAERLHGAIQAQRNGLLDRLRDLNQLEIACHRTGPTEAGWEGVQMVDSRRPGILAELTVLENATAADLIKFFLASSKARRETIERVLASRGFSPRVGEFIEVQP
ncbi:MAG TPA: hypothetical protein VNM47_18600 [Terriglobia bacterium]|nr:hypothetical protein [Terriglobia bacterium]